MVDLTVEQGGMAEDLMPSRAPAKPEISVAPKNDPITKAFMNKQPSLGDITSSLYRALGSPQRNKVSFGEALNNLRASQLKEAVQLEQIQRGRKADKRADKQLGLAENAQKMRQMELELRHAEKEAKAFSDVWKETTKNLTNKDKLKLYEYIKSPAAGQVDSGDIRGNILRAMDRIGIKQKPKDYKPTLAEKKYNRLIAQGYPPEEAEGLAFGYKKIYSDPVTGQHYAIDTRTNEKTPLNIANAGQVPKKLRIQLETQNSDIIKLVGRVPALEEAIKIAGGGISGRTQELFSKFGEQIPKEYLDAIVDEETRAEVQKVIEARATIGLFREDMRTALSKNPRMSLQEQKRILSLLPNTELGSSIPDNLSRLKSVRDRLDGILADNNITLGTASFAGSRDNPAKPTTQKEFDALPPGSFFINPKDGSLRRK